MISFLIYKEVIVCFAWRNLAYFLKSVKFTLAGSDDFARPRNGY